MKVFISEFVNYKMKNAFPYINLKIEDWIAILICAVPAFYLLGTPAIYIWDEAVYANASFDIANGSSWIVPVHGDYNTKPPLVLWLQAIFLLFIPSAEWAIRLPSALATLGILFVLLIGLKRWGFDFWTRLLVLVCFVGHEGFIRHHIGRTGDLDAVMTFFVTAYTMVALDAMHRKYWSNKHMLFFFLAFVGAFYSKSIAGWMMMAPLGVVWMLSPIRLVLIRPRFIISVVLSIGVCLMYYLIREQLQPGYLELTWHSEYMRIAKNVMPWHEHGPAYYFLNFVQLKTFTPWVFLLIGAILYTLIFLKDVVKRSHLFRWMLLSLGYMLIITFPAVKLEWYDAPAFPIFAMITGVVLGHFVSMIPSRWRILILIPVVFVLGRKLLFVYSDSSPRHPFENEGFILRHTAISSDTKVFMKVETPEHQLQLDFYRKVILDKQKIDVPVLNDVHDILVGDEIIVRQNHHLEDIQNSFIIDTIKQWDDIGYTIKIIEKRE